MNATADLVVNAAAILKYSQEATGLSSIELAAVFRIAAQACDEMHLMNEKAKVAAKFGSWKP